MTKQIKRRQALMADIHVAAAFRLSWWNLTLKNTRQIKILLHSNLLKLTVVSILEIVTWPSRLKICTKQQNRLVNPSAKACWVWRLDNECPSTLALFLWTKTQRWIFSSTLIFSRSSRPRASEHRTKNAVNNRSQNPGNGVAEWGWDVGRHAWLWILWKSTAQAPLSIVTSLGCSLVSLSLSRGWQNYLLHQSWGQANAPHIGLHFTQPAPLWPRRHRQSCWSVSGSGHPPFCAPQGLWLSCSAAWSCLCSLLLSCYTDGSV